MIAERFNGLVKGDTVVMPIRSSFVVIPFELSHRVLIISRRVNCRVNFFVNTSTYAGGQFFDDQNKNDRKNPGHFYWELSNFYVPPRDGSRIR